MTADITQTTKIDLSLVGSFLTIMFVIIYNYVTDRYNSKRNEEKINGLTENIDFINENLNTILIDKTKIIENELKELNNDSKVNIEKLKEVITKLRKDHDASIYENKIQNEAILEEKLKKIFSIIDEFRNKLNITSEDIVKLNIKQADNADCNKEQLLELKLLHLQDNIKEFRRSTTEVLSILNKNIHRIEDNVFTKDK